MRRPHRRRARELTETAAVADLEEMLQAAEQALEQGRSADALELALEAQRLDATSPDAFFLQAEARLDLADFAAAEAAYLQAAGLAPDEPTVLSGLGICRFELARIQEAAEDLRRALALEPDMAEAHHHLGLALEHLGQQQEADQHLAHARRLAPAAYRAPVGLSIRQFEACVEAALADLPESVVNALQNVTVTVEDLPPLDELLLTTPPLSPQLLGLWRGTPLSERTVFDPWSEMPSAIVLYQKNLQRFARDEHELTEQIRITVLHEVGHALGLDEQALIERGLE